MLSCNVASHKGVEQQRLATRWRQDTLNISHHRFFSHAFHMLVRVVCTVFRRYEGSGTFSNFQGRTHNQKIKVLSVNLFILIQGKNLGQYRFIQICHPGMHSGRKIDLCFHLKHIHSTMKCYYFWPIR